MVRAPCLRRSYEHPGMSWRVGVTPIMDPTALARLGPMGIAMMGKRTVSARPRTRSL